MRVSQNGQIISRGTSSANGPGYVIALTISWLVCAVMMLLPGLGDYQGAAILAVVVVYVPLLWSACAIVGLPVALIVVLTLHFGLRRVRWEWVHVLVAGAAAAGSGFVWLRLIEVDTIENLNFAWVVASIGVGAALGRALASEWITL